MNLKDLIEVVIGCRWYLLLLVVALVALAFQPYMEMRTYNKFATGQKANIVDAIFGELRINSK